MYRQRRLTFIRIGDILNVRMRSPWMWPAFVFNQFKILHGFSRQVVLS
jgi:hypothetical protein